MMQMMQANGNHVPRPGSVLNGPPPAAPGGPPPPRASSAMGGRKQSANSLLGGQRGGPHPGHPAMGPYGPMMMMPGAPNAPGGKPSKSKKKSGTFSARQKKGVPPAMPPGFMVYPGPYGPQMGPAPYGPPHPAMMQQPMYAGMPPLVPMPQPGGQGPYSEEPIYMPQGARPISPVASYQPGQFPYDAYYSQQQYATIDKANRYRKNKRPSNGQAIGPGTSHKGEGGAHKGQSSDSNAENESDFAGGAGAPGGPYGVKKGNINERAFGYSIRNEQRSRSYGSLSGPGNGVEGGAGGSGLDEPDNNNLKQMMSDLELGEDHIERSEVPPGLYPPPPGPYGAPHMGGPPPHMVMMPHGVDMGAAPPPPQMANGPSRKKR